MKFSLTISDLSIDDVGVITRILGEGGIVPDNRTAATVPAVTPGPPPPVTAPQPPKPFVPDATPPAPVAGGVEVDNRGMPWDERIHSGTPTLTAKGRWKNRRNVKKEVREAVEAELLGTAGVAPATAEVAQAAPTPPAPTVPVAPAVPPAAALPPPGLPGAAPMTAPSTYEQIINRLTAIISKGQAPTPGHLEPRGIDTNLAPDVVINAFLADVYQVANAQAIQPLAPEQQTNILNGINMVWPANG